MEDFEIDGMGATLVFRRPSDFSILPQYAVVENDSNFLVKNCKRVKISNINSDWDWEADPLGTFVRIISKHPAEGGTPPILMWSLSGTTGIRFTVSRPPFR